MWGWLNRLIDRRIAATLDARRDVDKQDARRLISEMEDALEKFSRVVARQAMRSLREARRKLKEVEDSDEGGETTPQLVADPRQLEMPVTGPAASRKEELRRKFGPRMPATMRRTAE